MQVQMKPFSILQAEPFGPATTLRLRSPSSRKDDLRERIGEFAGNIFYGTLIRQMESSAIRGKYFHGGRGEEAFAGQLRIELARRMGRSKNDPVTRRLYEAVRAKQDMKRETGA